MQPLLRRFRILRHRLVVPREVTDDAKARCHAMQGTGKIEYLRTLEGLPKVVEIKNRTLPNPKLVEHRDVDHVRMSAPEMLAWRRTVRLEHDHDIVAPHLFP